MPVPVSPGEAVGKTIKSVSVGYLQTCAIASDNKVYCWGRNAEGQLGNGSTTSSLLPVKVTDRS